MSLFSQVPQGRYFNKIQGTIWQSSEQADKETCSDLKDFGLSIIEIEVDSLKSSSFIWTFNETLKIESFDSDEEERILILECKHLHDKENKTLKLIIDNKQLEYNYVPVSTGAYVGFTKKKN